jgi:hypothetical protein
MVAVGHQLSAVGLNLAVFLRGTSCPSWFNGFQTTEDTGNSVMQGKVPDSHPHVVQPFIWQARRDCEP